MLLKSELKRKPTGSDHATCSDSSMFYATAKGFKERRDSCTQSMPKVTCSDMGVLPDMQNIALWLQSADQPDSTFIQVTPETMDMIIGNYAYLDDLLEPFSGFKREVNSRLTELTIYYIILKQAIAPAAGAPAQPQRKAPKAGILALRVSWANKQQQQPRAASPRMQDISDNDAAEADQGTHAAQKVKLASITTQYVHQYAKELHPQHKNGQFYLFAKGRIRNPRLVVSVRKSQHMQASLPAASCCCCSPA